MVVKRVTKRELCFDILLNSAVVSFTRSKRHLKFQEQNFPTSHQGIGLATTHKSDPNTCSERPEHPATPCITPYFLPFPLDFFGCGPFPGVDFLIFGFSTLPVWTFLKYLIPSSIFLASSSLFPCLVRSSNILRQKDSSLLPHLGCQTE